MQRIVLIGDIISSREIKNRSLVQKKLKRQLDKINAESALLISPLTLTLGDEFQSVYKSAGSLFGDIWKIILTLHPLKLRFSIGVGDLTTPINKKQAIGMDGPAFYFARKGIDELKQSQYLFNINSDSLENISLAKQSLFLISELVYNWKYTRIAILKMLYDGMSVKQISKTLKITDKAVYKNISAGSLLVIKNITDEISSIVNTSIKKK